MNDAQLKAAVEYNTKASVSLWKQSELPFPLNSPTTPPTGSTFALLVSQFQVDHKLSVDGKLGPGTLSALRAIMADHSDPPEGNESHIPQLPAAPPVRQGCSNVIYVKGQKHAVPQELLDAGITCTNWVDDGETHFKARTRDRVITHLVIHESVTTSAPSTVRVLDKQGYGVHFMVCPDGHISQHNDPVTEQPIHASQLNGCSVGLEVVNPYCPKWLTAPWKSTIPATWWTWVQAGDKKAYVVPTALQLKACKALIGWLATLIPSIPYEFPTKDLGPARPKIVAYEKGAKPPAGIVAHSDFSSHADGRYVLEDLLNRAAVG